MVNHLHASIVWKTLPRHISLYFQVLDVIARSNLHWYPMVRSRRRTPSIRRLDVTIGHLLWAINDHLRTSSPLLLSLPPSNPPHPLPIPDKKVPSTTFIPVPLGNSSSHLPTPPTVINLPPSLPPAPLPIPDTTCRRSTTASSRCTLTPSGSYATSASSSPSFANHRPRIFTFPVSNQQGYQKYSAEASLLESAVVNLTKIIKFNHQQSNQLSLQVGEEVYTILSTISFTVEFF